MDCSVAKYGEERYNEIRDEMKHMLTKVGWKKPFVANQMPVLPLSGWMGDNLIEKSTNGLVEGYGHLPDQGRA
jgi:elongation factor 1-alpha